jgi:hypothetical protein
VVKKGAAIRTQAATPSRSSREPSVGADDRYRPSSLRTHHRLPPGSIIVSRRPSPSPKKVSICGQIIKTSFEVGDGLVCLFRDPGRTATPGAWPSHNHHGVGFTGSTMAIMGPLLAVP